MQIRYPAIIKAQEPSGYFVQFVDFDDVFTEGQTIEEAIFNASEVLTAMISWKLDNNIDIPKPSTNIDNAHYIAPDAKTQANLLIKFSRPLSDTIKPEKTKHWTSIKQLEKAASAVGKKLLLSFE